MTVKILDSKTKNEIHKFFKNKKFTKTQLAKRYGVHRRTIDRVIWEVNGEEDKSKRSHSAYNRAVKVLESCIDYSKTIVVCTPQQVMVTLSDGSQHTAFRNKDHFTRIYTLALEEKYEEMMKYVDLSNAVKEFTFGSDIRVADGKLFYYGNEIHSSIAARIIKSTQDATHDVNRYINFFRKLYANPSYKAVEHTYDFLVHNDLEINEEGDIIAFKYLSYDDGKPVDSHTGKVPNWQGWKISMPRNMVEDDPNKTCSQGLHVGSEHYVGTWQEDQGPTPRVVKVAVNPTDVVSVPTDYDNSKMRCCSYKVLTGVANPLQNNGEVLVGEKGAILAISEE